MSTYYSNVRKDIAPLLPNHADAVLEIGSGDGATIAWLKQRWPESHFTAVDGYEPSFEQLCERSDVAILADLNADLPSLDQYDLILALDVLEHLISPDQLLKRLVSHLRPGGTVLVSVPNIARLSVSIPLLFGHFRYADDGILDHTHLRFFTQESAVELMNAAGLTVTEGLMTGLGGFKTKLIDRLTFGVMRGHLGRQIVMRGSPGQGQGSLRWQGAH
jgi:2-polyprenyl-3-methyl-5-hydroxy-6-metoxy-1,4-benzoquinol methylase